MPLAMTRLPVIVSFLLFLALAATLAWWVLQWTAPSPHTVSLPPKSERAPISVTAAASLFGGRSQGTSIAHVQLRGIVHAGRTYDSVAIITVEGKSPRTVGVNSEIAPGMKVKQILNKTVVVLEQGVERELSLPSFTAQESNVIAQPGMPAPTNTPQANAPAVLSPGPSTSSGAHGGSGTQGSGMASAPEHSRMPPQGLPAAPSAPSAPAPAGTVNVPLNR